MKTFIILCLSVLVWGSSCGKRTVVRVHERHPNEVRKLHKKEVIVKRPIKGNENTRTKLNYKEYHVNGKRKTFEKSRDLARVFRYKSDKPERKIQIKNYNEKGRLTHRYVESKGTKTNYRYDNGRLVYMQIIENGRVTRVIDVTKDKVVKR